MGSLQLWLCAGVLLFLPSLNARNIKLVPTETKTVTTNGATHEISRYRVVPDEGKDNDGESANGKKMRLQIAPKSAIINGVPNDSSDSKVLVKLKPKSGNAEGTNSNADETTTKPEDGLKTGAVKYHVLIGSHEEDKDDTKKLESMSLLKHDGKPKLNVVPLSYQNGYLNGQNNPYIKTADVMKSYYKHKGLAGPMHATPIANQFEKPPRAEIDESDESDEKLDSPGDHNEFGHIETKTFETVYNPTKVTNTQYTEMPWQDGIYTETHDVNSPYFINQYGINQTFALPGKRGLFKIIHIDGHKPVLEKPTFEHSTSNPTRTDYFVDLSRNSNDDSTDPGHRSLSIKSSQHSDTVPTLKQTNVVTKTVSGGNGAMGLTLRKTNSHENHVTHSVETNHNIEDNKSTGSGTDNKAVTIIFGLNNGEHSSDKIDTSIDSENKDPNNNNIEIIKTVTRKTIKEPIGKSDNSDTNTIGSTETTHNIKVTKYVTTSPAIQNMRALQMLDNTNVGGFTFKINSQENKIAKPETDLKDIDTFKLLSKETGTASTILPRSRIETEENHNHITITKTVTKSTKKEPNKDSQIVVISVQSNEQAPLNEPDVIGSVVPRNIKDGAPIQDFNNVSVTKSFKRVNNDHKVESVYKTTETSSLIEDGIINKHVSPVSDTTVKKAAQLSPDNIDNSKDYTETTAPISQVTKLNIIPLENQSKPKPKPIQNGESKTKTPVVTKNYNKVVSPDSGIVTISLLEYKNKNATIIPKIDQSDVKAIVRSNTEKKAPSSDSIVRISLLENNNKINLPISRTQTNNIESYDLVIHKENKNVRPKTDGIINISLSVNGSKLKEPEPNSKIKAVQVENQPNKIISGAAAKHIHITEKPSNDGIIHTYVSGSKLEKPILESPNKIKNIPALDETNKLTVLAKKQNIDFDIIAGNKVFDTSIDETKNAEALRTSLNKIEITSTEKPYTRTTIVTENVSANESEKSNSSKLNDNAQLSTDYADEVTIVPQTKPEEITSLPNTNSKAKTNSEIKLTPDVNTLKNNMVHELTNRITNTDEKTKITNPIKTSNNEIKFRLDDPNKLGFGNNNNNNLAAITTGLKVTPFYSNQLKRISESDEDYESSEKVLRSGWKDSAQSDEDPYPFDDGSRSSRITYREQITDSEASEADKSTDQLKQYGLPQTIPNPLRTNAYYDIAPNPYNYLLNPYKAGCSGNANFANMQGFQNLFAIDEQALQYILNYLIANNILTDLNSQYAAAGQGVDLSGIRLACITRYLQNIGVYNRLSQQQLMYLIEQIRQRESVTVKKNKDHKIEIIYENDDNPVVPTNQYINYQPPTPVVMPNQYIVNPGYYYNPYNINALRMNQNFRLIQDYAYLQQFLLEGFDENTENIVAVTGLCKRVIYLIAYLRKCGIPDASIVQFILEVKKHLRTEVLETFVTECTTKAHLSIAQRIDLVAKQVLQNHLYKRNPYQYYSNPYQYY